MFYTGVDIHSASSIKRHLSIKTWPGAGSIVKWSRSAVVRCCYNLVNIPVWRCHGVLPSPSWRFLVSTLYFSLFVCYISMVLCTYNSKHIDLSLVFASMLWHSVGHFVRTDSQGHGEGGNHWSFTVIAYMCYMCCGVMTAVWDVCHLDKLIWSYHSVWELSGRVYVSACVCARVGLYVYFHLSHSCLSICLSILLLFSVLIIRCLYAYTNVNVVLNFRFWVSSCR